MLQWQLCFLVSSDSIDSRSDGNRPAGGAGRRVLVPARRLVRAGGRRGGRVGVRVPGGLGGRALRAPGGRLRVGALQERRPVCGRRGLVGVRVRAGLGGPRLRRARLRPALPLARHLRHGRLAGSLHLSAAAGALGQAMLRVLVDSSFKLLIKKL